MDYSFLRSLFPNLTPDNARKTSEQSPFYNCIAWAAEDVDNRWWPIGGYWPATVDRSETVECFFRAYATLGYEICDHGDAAPGTEKLAIYALKGTPTHAARQLANGHWTSKLGELEDIEHTLDALEGDQDEYSYGFVVAFMSRPRRG